MRRVVLLLVVAALVAGCGGSKIKSSPALRGTPLDGKPAPSFALHDADGHTVTLASLRGKRVLVTFLYTHCPDTCPLIAENLAIVLRQLGPRAHGVRAVAISVDPKGDTPASVRHFVAQHRLPSQFLYLIGSRAQLASVWAGFHIAAQPGPDQTINHSAYTMLLDAGGHERVLYDAQVKPTDVLHDLRALG
jgi:protein SCO1